MRTVPLEIVTSDRKVFSGEVTMIIARGGDGELGVLPGHTPLITTLKTAPLRIKLEDDTKEVQVAVSGGFLEVQPNKITVLAASAELVSDIDVSRAERSKERAERRLNGGDGNEELNRKRAEQALERAVNRLSVGKMNGK